MYISDLEGKLAQGQGGEQFGTRVTSMQGSQVPQNRSKPRHHEEVELSHAGARPAHPRSSWDDSPPGAGAGGGLLGVTGAAATEDPAVLGGSGVTEPQPGACN